MEEVVVWVIVVDLVVVAIVVVAIYEKVILYSVPPARDIGVESRFQSLVQVQFHNAE
jgi:hypothetical protein